MTPRHSQSATRRPGVRDVATVAGVSTQTVSRVLNGTTSVREETRQRVIDAMGKLSYRPNNAARALGSARTRTLGVIASDVTLYGPGAAIAALAGAAREVGMWLATAYANAAEPASVAAAADHLMAQGVDGIVIVAPHTQSRGAVSRLRLGIPVVPMHVGSADRQRKGQALAVDHLVGLGHRRIARLGGPANWVEEASRRTGFDAALAAHSLTAVRHWSGDWTARSGAARAAAAARAMRSGRPVTAVVAANDQMALGLMSALGGLGVQVPADLSVVGFDDNPDAAHYSPALTTVRLDLDGEARRCVAAVVAPDQVPLTGPPTLVVRASTAGPPRPGRA